ncbi:MAG: hypothetical protein K2X38_01290 [Gemmataceae bacterium]|nr:hypothetical protein [Gemmataceae bacterium]
MSTVPVFAEPPVRHALGLPAGSVRATHILAVVGLVCAILLIPTRAEAVPVPPYLVYLLFLLLGHFFAAHGVTISAGPSHPRPLYLPGGFVRLFVFLALAGTIGYHLFADPNNLEEHFGASVDELKKQPITPLVILAGFFLGLMLRAIIGNSTSAGWKDIEAWISLIALAGLVVAGIIHLVISPTSQENLSMPNWEAGLGAVVAFYFGERS